MKQQFLSGQILRTSLFEIKLRSDLGREPLIFTTVQPDEEAAARVGLAMLESHHEFDSAEIWQGMRLLKQV